MRRPPNILLFSHDSYGLGHLRRTMTLAQALASSFDGARVLVASGSPCATLFGVPPGVDVVKLPSATKDEDGRYVSRTLRTSLAGLVELRARIVSELFDAFAPDLFIVDHQVLGLAGELVGVLERARTRRTRTILGIRDVIDDPAVVAREWGHPRVRRALATEYDRVCVYGDPSIFDPRVEYPIPAEIRQRVEFVGYVVRPSPEPRAPLVPPTRPHVLVTVGGGEDGAERVEAYVEALEAGPVAWESTIVLGPLFEADRAREIKRRARRLSAVEVHRFHADLPRMMQCSNAVVAMAGYNTVAEILASGTPAVLLPRTHPRREQILRAERLAARGFATCLPEPDPAKIRSAVENALAAKGPRPAPPPLDGAARLCDVAAELLGAVQLAAGARARTRTRTHVPAEAAAG